MVRGSICTNTSGQAVDAVVIGEGPLLFPGSLDKVFLSALSIVYQHVDDGSRRRQCTTLQFVRTRFRGHVFEDTFSSGRCDSCEDTFSSGRCWPDSGDEDFLKTTFVLPPINKPTVGQHRPIIMEGRIRCVLRKLFPAAFCALCWYIVEAALYKDCDTRLPNGECPVLEISGDPSTYLQEHVKSKHAGLWVVNFYATWCPHCQVYAPKFKQIAEEYVLKNKKPIKFASVDCEAFLKVCAEEQVHSYPTMKVFNADAETEEDKTKPAKASELRTAIDAALEKMGSGGAAEPPPASAGAGPPLPAALTTTPPQQPAGASPDHEPVTKDASGAVTFGKYRFSGESQHSLNKRLHDAAVGLVYSLKITTFLHAEKNRLLPDIWASLQNWLDFVSLTFPRATFRDDLVALLREMQVFVLGGTRTTLVGRWSCLRG